MGLFFLVARDGVDGHEAAQVGEAYLAGVACAFPAVGNIGHAVLLHQVADELFRHLGIGVGTKVVVLTDIFDAVVDIGPEGLGVDFEEAVVNLGIAALRVLEEVVVAVVDDGVGANHIHGYQEGFVDLVEDLVVKRFYFIVDAHKAFRQQFLLVGKGLVQGALGDVHRGGDIVHRHAFAPARIKQLEGCFYDFFFVVFCSHLSVSFCLLIINKQTSLPAQGEKAMQRYK